MNSLQTTLCALVCGVLGTAALVFSFFLILRRGARRGTFKSNATVYVAAPKPPSLPLPKPSRPYIAARLVPATPRTAPSPPSQSSANSRRQGMATLPKSISESRKPPMAPAKFWEIYLG